MFGLYFAFVVHFGKNDNKTEFLTKNTDFMTSNKILNIKITGEGTREAIINALKTLVKDIETIEDEQVERGQDFEDETLFTEVREVN